MHVASQLLVSGSISVNRYIDRLRTDTDDDNNNINYKYFYFATEVARSIIEELQVFTDDLCPGTVLGLNYRTGNSRYIYN